MCAFKLQDVKIEVDIEDIDLCPIHSRGRVGALELTMMTFMRTTRINEQRSRSERYAQASQKRG